MKITTLSKGTKGKYKGDWEIFPKYALYLYINAK